MENLNKFKTTLVKYSLITVTIIIAVSILSNAYISRNKENEVIQVTGLGSKDFESDLIVWTGAYTQVDKNLKDAYEKLYVDQGKIVEFLKKRSLSENDYIFSSVTINKLYDNIIDVDKNQKQIFKGYSLRQELKIESKEINKVEKISREISELINMGIEFYSFAPAYYYTQMSELKKELIEQATENATERAKTIATKAGFDLGRLKSANMGVIQIIARNSNEDYSWAGSYNTSSKQKTATITMKLQFGIK